MSSAAELYPTPRTLEDAETSRLYEAYADRILAYCTRRLRSRSDAEDAVQTTFLYALRALRRGVEPECESAWLYTIARNVCSWQQRTAARRCPIADDFELESLACAETDEDVERLSGLRDALQSLPARQREALVLREWHGVPAREIAAELGLTGPQTHALLTRARHALAQALTAPGKAALGLGALVVGVRAHFKAVLGGVAAKAAATVTIVVAGAGVTGAVAEESSAERAARDRAILAAVTTSDSANVGTVARSDSTMQSRTPGATTVHAETHPAGGTPHSGDARPDTAAPAPSSPAPAAPGATVELPPVTVELPGDVPAVAVPAVKLPAVKLPAVELPPVELPPVELPPVDLPLPVEVPPVQTPPVELPAVQVPSPLGPDPLVDIPPTVIPPVTLNP